MVGSLYQSDIPKTVTASSPELETKHNSTHSCRFFFIDNHDTVFTQSHIASLFSCKKKAKIRRRSLVLIIAARFGNRSPVATKPTPDFTSPIYSHFHHAINPYPSLLRPTIRYIYFTIYPSRPNMHHSIANTTTMTPGTFVPMDGPSVVQDSVSSINSIPGRSILLGVILVVNSVWLLGKAIMIVGWGNDNGSDAVTGTFPHACLSDLGICHSSRLKRRS